MGLAGLDSTVAETFTVVTDLFDMFRRRVEVNKISIVDILSEAPACAEGILSGQGRNSCRNIEDLQSFIEILHPPQMSLLAGL